MAVVEVGIIKNGIPIFRLNFRPEDLSTVSFSDFQNAIIRSGWFTAIQGSIQLAFDDDAEELHFKNYKILIQHLKPYILYITVDKDTKILIPVKKALNSCARIIQDASNRLNTHSPQKNAFLEPIFNEIFKDLQLTSMERVKRLF